MSASRSMKKPTVDVDFTLKRVFSKSSFRPYQREIIIAALEGHDVFVQAGVFSDALRAVSSIVG